MAGHYDPAQPRDKGGEWTNGAEAVASHFTSHRGGSRKPKAAVHDLSTREGRAAAVASADITTPAGRSLVRRAQRASEESTPRSFVPGSAVPKTPARTRKSR